MGYFNLVELFTIGPLLTAVAGCSSMRDGLLGHHLGNRVRYELVVLRRRGGSLHLPSLWSFRSPHQTVSGLDPMHRHGSADERPPERGATRDATLRYLTLTRRLTR